MHEYRRVGPTFWNGKTGKALKAKGPEAVIVALYLMTCQHSNMLGLYYLSKFYVAADTGLGMEGASKGLAWAIEAGFCRYDEASEVVWVVEMAAYQVGESLEVKDLRVKGIQRAYDALPDNPFLVPFYERYSGPFRMERCRDSDPGQKPLASPITSPLQAPIKPGAGAGAGAGEGAATGTGSLAPAAPPPPAADPPPPAPSPAPAAAGASADTTGEGSSRRKRLGKEWALPKQWGDWALAECPHWTADIVRKIAAQFRDHWVGNAEVKSDWEATWRNWCRSTITQREYPVPRGTAARETREQRLANAQAALDALDARRPVRPPIVDPARDPNTVDMEPAGAAPRLEHSDA